MPKRSVLFSFYPLPTVRYPHLTALSFLAWMRASLLLPVPSTFSHNHLGETCSDYIIPCSKPPPDFPSPSSEPELCSQLHLTLRHPAPAHLSDLVPCYACPATRPSPWAHASLLSVPAFTEAALCLHRGSSRSFYVHSLQPLPSQGTFGGTSDLSTYPKLSSSR